MNSPKRVLVSANDPGGANAIVPVVQALIARGDTVCGIVTGPARDIFLRTGMEMPDASGYRDADIKRETEAFKTDVFLSRISTPQNHL